MKRRIILHNIRSAHNVGAIFRTADGAGVSEIYLTGYTPLPIDRFGREHPEIAKTSLKATTSVRWEHRDDVYALIEDLKKQKVQIIAIEQHPQAVGYTQLILQKDVAFIFGNEVDGIEEKITENADAIAEIQMSGKKESLNVATAAGIILFSARDRS